METGQTLVVGTLAGNYRVMSELGTGSMGRVYQAEHVTTGKRVGLKVLHKHHQEEFAARFLREGKTLRLLNHPNIVELVAMGQLDNGSLYLATELVEGEPLRATMDRGPIEQRRALAIIRQVLDALDAAHALGVVHRDIKPENIMLAAGDTVKVLDFGVAKLLADTVAGLGEANLTMAGLSVFGSALYIAPESVVGAKVDARIDLYSAGAVLYEMITGKPPYDHPDPTELLKLHAFAPVPTLQAAAPGHSFTPEVEYLVGTALAKKPEERFRSAADMIAAVDAAAESLGAITGATQRPRVWPTEENPVVKRAPTELVARRDRWQRLRGLPPKYLYAFAGGLAVVILVATLVALSGRSESDAAPRTSELAAQANALLAAGDPKSAADLIERADARQRDGSAHLALGHARFALDRKLDALASYEQALRALPSLATDKELRKNLAASLDTKDSLAAVLALDLLASLPDRDAVASYAATGKLADGRRRARMIAERDGFADKIDRVESWSLDLQQTASCDERKLLIEKLAATNDKRALATLKRLKVKCVERETADAIARLEAAK